MSSAAWLATAGVLSIPHILYAFTWTRPKAFKKYLVKKGKNPVDQFAEYAHTLKVLQFTAVIFWYIVTGPLYLPDTIFWWLLGVGCIAAGQVLNAGIYAAIGKVGVYYGTRLGATVPWVDGFPFNVVRHPQYVGAVLSVWGAYILFAGEEHQAAGGFALAAVWTIYYAITGYIEDNMRPVG